MGIYKVNSSLPPSTKINKLNEMILELEGLIEKSKFNLNEMISLYSGTGLSKEYLRNVGIGNTLSTYSNWSHIRAEDSYSIWKYTPDNYAYNSNNNLYFDNKVLENRGEADSETTLVFDKVFLYNGTYVDDTTEAGTEGGTSFNLMAATTDYIYFGSSSTFKGVSFEFNARGSNYSIIPEFYHTGAGWCGLTSTVDSLDDQTSNFTSDGRISWDLDGSGSGWIKTPVNSQHLYWARIKTTLTPITVATADSIVPSNSVIGLLSLSGDEVIDEDWAWCSYNNSIYATIRNKGASAYEGDYYITSASSSTNLKNYFIYNHEFTADYEDNSYIYTLLTYDQVRISANDTTTGYLSSKLTTGSGLFYSIENAGANEKYKLNLAVSGAFLSVAVSGQNTISADSHYDTLNLTTGAGISITTDANTNTITFDNSSVNSIYTFKNIAISGQDTVVADLEQDTLTIATGAGITITTDAATDTITFNTNVTDSFKNIAVSGQNSVVADLGQDTLTIATGAGISITTNADNDTISFNSYADIASISDIDGGINNVKSISPYGLNGSIHGSKTVELKAVSDSTALSSGTAMSFFIPSTLNGMNLIDADAGVHTVSTGAGLPTIALYNANKLHNILSTNITIDLNEKTSYTATILPVIDTNYDDVSTGDEISINVDVAGPGAQGLDVILIFRK